MSIIQDVTTAARRFVNPFARPLPYLLVALLVTACGGAEDDAGAEGESEAELVERARGIHERVITLDTHDDINVEQLHRRAELHHGSVRRRSTLPKHGGGRAGRRRG